MIKNMADIKNPDIKWYKKPGGIALLFLLFWPVGIYLMWKYTNWSRLIKWSITTILVLSQIFVYSTILSNPVTPNYSITVPQTPQEPQKQQPTYNDSLPKFLSFICSKSENNHNAYYYLINDYYYSQKNFPLQEKLTGVDVRISKIVRGKGGWDTEFLCNPNSEIDLPEFEWQILTAGKDCGLGAKISPCDIDFVSDDKGVTEIIIAPTSGGLISSIPSKYFKKGALLKVTGRIVK